MKNQDGPNSSRNPLVLWRDRVAKSPYPLRTILADAVINEENGFYIVDQGKSAIFLSHDGLLSFCLWCCANSRSGHQDIVIELVALRGIGRDEPAMQDLYTALAHIVQTACAERRDVRV